MLGLAPGLLCLFAVSAVSAAASSGPPPVPASFSAKSEAYPPAVREVMLYYDYTNLRARADIIAGYEAGRVYVRRYDTKNEYMVRAGKFPECKRSYLGETMPLFAYPDGFRVTGVKSVKGRDCDEWTREDEYNRVTVYVDREYAVPLQLVDEMLTPGAPPEKLMTYEFSTIVIEAQDASLFAVPAPWTHKSCERYIGGFPYLHLFHYYLRV